MGFNNFSWYHYIIFILLTLVSLLFIFVGILYLSNSKIVFKVKNPRFLGTRFLILGIIVLIINVIWVLVVYFKKDIYETKLKTPVGKLHIIGGSYPYINGISGVDNSGNNFHEYIDTYPKIYGKFGMRRYLMNGTKIATGTYSDINWLDDSFLVYDGYSSEQRLSFTFKIPEQDLEFSDTYYEIVGQFYENRDSNFVLSKPIKGLQEVAFGNSTVAGELIIIESNKNKLIQ